MDIESATLNLQDEGGAELTKQTFAIKVRAGSTTRVAELIYPL